MSGPAGLALGAGVAVRTDRLEVRRGRTTIAEDLFLELREGETVQLHGANGAGKTSLLRVLSGVAPPFRGRLVCSGSRAYVPERSIMPARLRGEEWIEAAAGTRRRGNSRGVGEVPSQIADLRSPLAAVSQGQLQTLLLFEALARSPSFLLLDEPWNGLDSRAARWLDDQIDSVAALGIAVLFTCHGAPGCRVDRSLSLEQGRLSEHQLERRPAPMIVRARLHARQARYVVEQVDLEDLLRKLLDHGAAIEDVRRR